MLHRISMHSLVILLNYGSILAMVSLHFSHLLLDLLDAWHHLFVQFLVISVKCHLLQSFVDLCDVDFDFVFRAHLIISHVTLKDLQFSQCFQ